MAKRHFKGEIWYTMDEQHPDRGCVPDWTPIKVEYYSDVYKIDEDYFYGRDDIEEYITHDLKLVAGGGYNTDHIHNCRVEISLA